MSYVAFLWDISDGIQPSQHCSEFGSRHQTGMDTKLGLIQHESKSHKTTIALGRALGQARRSWLSMVAEGPGPGTYDLELVAESQVVEETSEETTTTTSEWRRDGMRARRTDG